jgi:hypothetical protein
MGYDVHITRKDNWYDDDNASEISLKEWNDYVSNDPDFRVDNFAQVDLPAGQILRIEKEGICVWTKYSRDGEDQNHAWFIHSRGNITVKNPDQEIINKMVQVAQKLNAKVQGDEDELYGKEDYLDQTLHDVATDFKKPWWKFW